MQKEIARILRCGASIVQKLRQYRMFSPLFPKVIKSRYKVCYNPKYEKFSFAEGHTPRKMAGYDLTVRMTNLIEGTIAAAIKVIRNEYDNRALTIRTIYQMILRPVFAALNLSFEADSRKGG